LSVEKSVLIIGSGISSLTTAIILLKEGFQVTILEQHFAIGGFLHCFKRSGFKYETGGHYLGALGKGLPFRQLLTYLGVYDEDDYVELDKNEIDIYHFKNTDFSYGVGYDLNIKKLCEKFPENSKSIKQYFSKIKISAESFPTYYFKSNYDQSEMLSFLEISLSEVFSELNIVGELREILEAPCILHGVSSKDVSFGIHSILIDSIFVSAHGFKHGGEKLARRFTERIEDLGGKILTRKKVNKIEVDSKKITKVICEDGDEFFAEKYIAGIHPKLIFSMIGHQHLRPSFTKRLNKIKESSPFVGAYVVLDQQKYFNPRSNYYIFPEGTSEKYDAESINLKKLTIFIASPKREFQGEGKYPLSIHASCPNDFFQKWSKTYRTENKLEYIKAKEEIFEQIFIEIEKRYKGFTNSIVSISLSSPLTNQYYNPSPNGSAYGIYHDFSCTGARAFGPRTHIENLFLTGQNTLFPGLLGASVSGIRTAGHFIGIKRLLSALEAS
jgi:all-trans-retinol 13,14-reductase